MSVQEIEQAISTLNRSELSQFISWFDEHRAELWDKQIEEDLAAGRLDRILDEVDAEYSAGLHKPL